MPPSGARGPLVVLAPPGDPFARHFTEVAVGRGVETWEPATLDEVWWCIDSWGRDDPTLGDRATGRSWRSSALTGVWFQGYPPLRSAERWDPRSQEYVDAEFAASLACLREELRCLQVGLPPLHLPAVGNGLQSRAELRRSFAPVLEDRLVSSAEVEQLAHARRTWCHRWDRGSTWVSDLGPCVTQHDTEQGRETVPETWGITELDERRVLAVVRMRSHTKAIEVDDDRISCVDEADADAVDALRVSGQLCELSGSAFGVTHFARQSGRWALARHGLQLPHWMFDTLRDWFCQPLLEGLGIDG